MRLHTGKDPVAGHLCHRPLLARRADHLQTGAQPLDARRAIYVGAQVIQVAGMLTE
ncbi:hypothetical protein [Endozoicomonas sp. SESOKO4]|uniref:hypothetical protein n=1 Tax=Endozoicomonas sp. SESOKO4 TaxID=2828745 RepID=UPI00214801AA|nr:hypothetical protein [Endozoicomonas sp. SESOKO4]